MIKDYIQKGRRALYVAEIGLNHNGDPDMARTMIAAAADAGADAVKFQTIVPEKMNSPYTASLLATGNEGEPDRSVIDFFSRFVLPVHVYRELKNFAELRGIIFFSSPFDAPSVDLLESINVPLYKIASSEVTNHALITLIAETGKPAILSTGISTVEEIDSAVECFTSKSPADLALLHCVSLYPAPPEKLNLKRIVSLKERYRLTVGFSDHSRGSDAVVVAAALGAEIFEKHFTVDRNYDCPDKDVSLAPEEFSSMIDASERAAAMLGEGAITCGTAEEPVARAARRSLFAARPIPGGKVIEADDLEALRPGTGIPPSEILSVMGKKCLRDIDRGKMIRREFIE